MITILQVREDNAAIASLDSNAANLKEQIKKVQELIEQAEQVIKVIEVRTNVQRQFMLTLEYFRIWKREILSVTRNTESSRREKRPWTHSCLHTKRTSEKKKTESNN